MIINYLNTRKTCEGCFYAFEIYGKEKGESPENSLLFSTQTRGRTGMEVNPLVFETSASTDSAIWATQYFFCNIETLSLVPRPGVEPGWK